MLSDFYPHSAVFTTDDSPHDFVNGRPITLDSDGHTLLQLSTNYKKTNPTQPIHMINRIDLFTKKANRLYLINLFSSVRSFDLPGVFVHIEDRPRQLLCAGSSLFVLSTNLSMKSLLMDRYIMTNSSRVPFEPDGADTIELPELGASLAHIYLHGGYVYTSHPSRFLRLPLDQLREEMHIELNERLLREHAINNIRMRHPSWRVMPRSERDTYNAFFLYTDELHLSSYMRIDKRANPCGKGRYRVAETRMDDATKDALRVITQGRGLASVSFSFSSPLFFQSNQIVSSDSRMWILSRVNRPATSWITKLKQFVRACLWWRGTQWAIGAHRDRPSTLNMCLDWVYRRLIRWAIHDFRHILLTANIEETPVHLKYVPLFSTSHGWEIDSASLLGATNTHAYVYTKDTASVHSIPDAFTPPSLEVLAREAGVPADPLAKARNKRPSPTPLDEALEIRDEDERCGMRRQDLENDDTSSDGSEI